MRSAWPFMLAYGLLAVAGGSLYAAYWLLFESWSHSYLSPAYQQRETMAAFLIPTLLLSGTAALVGAAVGRAARKKANGPVGDK